MKNFSRYFFITLLLFSITLALPAVARQQTTVTDKGLLWKIQKKGVQTAYLFGTIHSEDARVLALSDAVKQALNNANIAVFELELGLSTVYQSVSAMYLEEGKTLDKVLNAEDYKAIIQSLAEKGYPEVTVKTMKPWAIMVFLSAPKPETGQFLDMVLYQKALKQGKKIIGLETADEQLSIFESMPLADQVTLLKDTLAHFDEIDGMLETMYKHYLARDLQGLFDFQETYIREKTDNPELEQALMVKMLDDRNIRMVERIVPILQKGKAFIAVGALHLAGKKGIIQQLRQQGYTVTAVW
ncbi:TraB/GumN family protein [Beggiatoa leptomitoformis]|uniref:TraB/GumN family protein n=1 Tax=Beggiatoa leptomitoformis TaxID=288004 RepID=A0A2N9YD50_9GAMM|nr:TraB/GumN family protein [Beggiatoa leptomitoformis]ALG69563.2 hypothetical protein AL038_17705 [Beggiatoa leptomitoformis]AUI68387.1 hypothetical protein BLE401_06525 [Beggiatoa leptomitoformis]